MTFQYVLIRRRPKASDLYLVSGKQRVGMTTSFAAATRFLSWDTAQKVRNLMTKPDSWVVTTVTY
jgi:hypothetical protein